MSQNLRILQLNDDLDQAFTEIKHLRDMNENLISERGNSIAIIDDLTVQNDALKMERDDLRNIINMADSGIAEINSHWKQKFFLWREREEELLKELGVNKDVLTEKLAKLTHEKDASFAKLKSENSKLVSDVSRLRSSNTQLQANLDAVQTEMEAVNDRLMQESKKSLKNSLVARDKEVLEEKVKVLESKLDGFYENSIKQSKDLPFLSVTRHEAERDCDVVTTELKDKITVLEDELKKKEETIKQLHAECEELAYKNEVCTTTVNNLRSQMRSNSAALDKANDDKLNTVKYRAAVDDLKANVESLKKINTELQNNLSSNYITLGQKDQQINDLKTCLETKDKEADVTVLQMGEFRESLDQAESEVKLLKRDNDDLTKDQRKLKDYINRIKEENKSLVGELRKCNNNLTKLRDKYREVGVSSTRSDQEKLTMRQEKINLEVEIHDISLQLKDAENENNVLKDEIKVLMNEINEQSTIIKSRDMKITDMQEDIKAYQQQSGKEIQDLKEELGRKVNEIRVRKADVSDRSVSTVSIITVDNSMVTDIDSVELQNKNQLRQRILDLDRETEMKERKLNFAQSRLQTQAAVIEKNKGEIEKLRYKLEARSKIRDSKSQNDLVNRLTIKVKELAEENVAKDAEIARLKDIEADLDKREETFTELSKLLCQLQLEIDGKHKNILNEVEFYKSRLMEYERINLEDRVNKSVNTSIIFEAEDLLSDTENPNVSELEVLMNNLKHAYTENLNEIESNFCQQVAHIGNKKDSWISLVSKD